MGWTASRESERPVPEDAQVVAGNHWPQVSGGDSGAGWDWGNGQMLPYAVLMLLAVMQGWLIGSWGSPGALGRSMRDQDAAPKDSHLQTQGTSGTEKTISQTLPTLPLSPASWLLPGPHQALHTPGAKEALREHLCHLRGAGHDAGHQMRGGGR